MMPSEYVLPINDNFVRYRTNARKLLRQIERDDFPLVNKWIGGSFALRKPVPKVGEWIKLGYVDNVGAKLLVWMVTNNLLIAKKGEFRGVTDVLDDWYKVAEQLADDADLGDLWAC